MILTVLFNNTEVHESLYVDQWLLERYFFSFLEIILFGITFYSYRLLCTHTDVVVINVKKIVCTSFSLIRHARPHIDTSKINLFPTWIVFKKHVRHHQYIQSNLNLIETRWNDDLGHIISLIELHMKWREIGIWFFLTRFQNHAQKIQVWRHFGDHHKIVSIHWNLIFFFSVLRKTKIRVTVSRLSLKKWLHSWFTYC